MQQRNHLEIHLEYLLNKEEFYLEKLKKRYTKMPHGKLAIRVKKRYFCCYLIKNGTESSIGRNNTLVEMLAEKSYLKLQIAMISSNIRALKKSIISIQRFFDGIGKKRIELKMYKNLF